MTATALPTTTRTRARRHAFVVLVAVILVAPVVLITAPAAEPREPPLQEPPRWVWPLDDRRVIRPFLAPARPWGPGHRGVDLAAARGAPVRAVGPGIVSFAGMVAGRGVITIIHGSLRTTYEPVDPLVRQGDRVGAGSPIGSLSGAGHCVPEICLHLGLLSGSTYLDPMSLFQPARVRLLPLRSEAVRFGSVRDAPR
jgi:murein DD-endopeptidase MepM/ murein hydrolase activator NlpD